MTSNASDRIIVLALIGILLVPVALVILFASDSPPPPATIPTATATPWLTNTVTPMLTAVNITPTMEVLCEAGSYGTVLEDTPVYYSALLDNPAYVAYGSGGTAHMELAHIQAGEVVIFLYDRTDNARMVVTEANPPRVGWIPVNVLSEECR